MAIGALFAERASAAERVLTQDPASGGVTGARPVFHFTVTGEWSASALARVELSRDHWKTVDRAYDMRDSPRGWEIYLQPNGDKGGYLRSPETLPEGLWEWRVMVFYSSGELAGAKPAAFRVDATPPAEVSGLRLERRKDGSLALSWDPVLWDAEGKPETVDRYVVYRYDARGIFTQPRVAELGETRSHFFLDRDEASAARSGRNGTPASRTGLRTTLYYMVVAVDTAGNELGRRDNGVPSRARKAPASSAEAGGAEPPAGKTAQEP